MQRIIEVNYLMVNPTICKREGEAQMQEGCLCLPGVMVDVTRSEKVTVSGLDAIKQLAQLLTEFGRVLVLVNRYSVAHRRFQQLVICVGA